MDCISLFFAHYFVLCFILWFYEVVGNFPAKFELNPMGIAPEMGPTTQTSLGLCSFSKELPTLENPKRGLNPSNGFRIF